MNSFVFVALFATIAVASAAVDGPAVIAGPSGYVARSGVASAGAFPYAAAPYVAAPYAAAVPAPYAAVAAPYAAIVPAGSGLEGQYIPDNLEKLYDDGSYKPYIYGF